MPRWKYPASTSLSAGFKGTTSSNKHMCKYIGKIQWSSKDFMLPDFSTPVSLLDSFRFQRCYGGKELLRTKPLPYESDLHNLIQALTINGNKGLQQLRWWRSTRRLICKSNNVAESRGALSSKWLWHSTLDALESDITYNVTTVCLVEHLELLGIYLVPRPWLPSSPGVSVLLSLSKSRLPAKAWVTHRQQSLLYFSSVVRELQTQISLHPANT